MGKETRAGSSRIRGFPPLLLLAALLLIFSAVTGIYAMLTHYSDVYTAQIETGSLDVALLENGNLVAGRVDRDRRHYQRSTGHRLMADLPGQSDGIIQLGRAYPEALSVQNSGTINAYVRVRITRYWISPEGEKAPTLSPELIQIHILTDQWLMDASASTPEQTVLYYPEILLPGETTPAFTDTVTLSREIAALVQEETDTDGTTTVIRTIYAYHGMQFCLEAEVDALQTHNATDAVASVWGNAVTVSGGKLRLN